MAKRLLVAAAIWTAAAIPAFGAADQNAPAPSGATSNPPAQNMPQAPTVDPYANNPGPATQAFPLAAPAGTDSRAGTVAPTGAVNQGPFDPASWKYGPAFDPPPGAKIWNPSS